MSSNIPIIQADSLEPKEFLNVYCDTRFIGRKIFHFESIDSTNKKAKELARLGLEEGTVIIADAQTSGKGRLDRVWHSPKGGVYLSVILRPKAEAMYLPVLTFLGAVAISKTMKRLYGIDTPLKWPNDVLLRGKKLCGILLESSITKNHTNFVIVGIGVNLNSRTENFPHALKSDVTTLRSVMKRNINKTDFIRAFLEEFEREYELFETGNTKAIIHEWKKLSDTIGKHVRIVTQTECIEGIATDINLEGALIIKTPRGDEMVYVGDCIYLSLKG